MNREQTELENIAHLGNMAQEGRGVQREGSGKPTVITSFGKRG